MQFETAEKYVTREYQSIVGWVAHYLARMLIEARMTPEAVVDEIYFRMRRKKEDWHCEDHLLNWVRRAAGHVLRDEIRRQRNRRPVWHEEVSVNGNLEAVGNPGETAYLVADALSRMGRTYPRQASVVSLRHLEGLTIRECAARLRISQTTVKRDATHAYAWLRQEFTS